MLIRPAVGADAMPVFDAIKAAAEIPEWHRAQWYEYWLALRRDWRVLVICADHDSPPLGAGFARVLPTVRGNLYMADVFAPSGNSRRLLMIKIRGILAEMGATTATIDGEVVRLSRAGHHRGGRPVGGQRAL